MRGHAWRGPSTRRCSTRGRALRKGGKGGGQSGRKGVRKKGEAWAQIAGRAVAAASTSGRASSPSQWPAVLCAYPPACACRALFEPTPPNPTRPGGGRMLWAGGQLTPHGGDNCIRASAAQANGNGDLYGHGACGMGVGGSASGGAPPPPLANPSSKVPPSMKLPQERCDPRLTPSLTRLDHGHHGSLPSEPPRTCRGLCENAIRAPHMGRPALAFPGSLKRRCNAATRYRRPARQDAKSAKVLQDGSPSLWKRPEIAP